jgi:general secretion pathway protein B
MSFILDALKKSESDRQQQNSPDIMKVPTGSDKSSSSRWMLIVGILLLINVAVLSFVILRPDVTSVETPRVATENDQALTDDAKTDDAEPFRDLVANARREQTVSSPPPAVETAPEPRRDDTPSAAAPVQASAQPDSVATIKQTPPPPTQGLDVYKTYNQVRIDGSMQLPNLHLDIHVYNDIPGERFVFINMNKYKEQATLSEGPTVSEIVPEGVILESSGTRFLLPRQ